MVLSDDYDPLPVALIATGPAWVESDGEQELPDMVDREFALLRRELGASDG